MSVNVVSYETAQKLKAAGFPQPAPGNEQHWYDPYEHLVYINEDGGQTSVYHQREGKWIAQPDKLPLNGKDAFYCPTIEDFKRELGNVEDSPLKPVVRVFDREPEDQSLPMVVTADDLEHFANTWLDRKKREVGPV